jgi:4'-phosphopantetheinyl transferase
MFVLSMSATTGTKESSEIWVYGASCTAGNFKQLLEQANTFLSPFLRQKVHKFSFEKDACRYLLGKWLLLNGIRALGYNGFALHQVQFTQYKKPFIPGIAHFNISHSGDYVLCAFCQNSPIGIDIERKKQINIADFENCFTAREWEFINTSDCKISAFYSCWTRKEAVVKADGRGINLFLHDVEILADSVELDGEKWFIRELPLFDNYIVHVATQNNDGVVNYIIHDNWP